MPMTGEQRARYEAAHLCALQASGTGGTLAQFAAAIGLVRPARAVWLALEAIVASLGERNWREVRAEAEAKLRSGWQPSKPWSEP
jgi:hypothetical protein